MVKEIIIPKDNLAQVEEVRELENTEQKKLDNQQESKSTIENIKETIIPTVYASDNLSEVDKQGKEEVEKVGGAIIDSAGAVTANPGLGMVASAGTKAMGEIESGIGKITGVEGLEVMGDTHQGMAERSASNIANTAKEAGKKIKEIFK
ncbi:13847_t:CDS:1 [Funneliformis geosporum]|nr:13847_t:CDS:1 [Funneliformis geosporum]